MINSIFILNKNGCVFFTRLVSLHDLPIAKIQSNWWEGGFIFNSKTKHHCASKGRWISTPHLLRLSESLACRVCLCHREVIIEKHYVGLVGRAICDKFWDAVTDVDDLQDVPPVLATPKWYLVHIQHHGLFFLAVVKNDTPPLLVLEFLQRVVEVFGHYMTDVTEEAIKDKFVIVYQVLDEMMDGGFPFTTEPNVLTSMINKTNLLSELMENIPVPGTLNVPLPMSLGGKISMGSRAISLAAPIGTSNQLPRAAGSTVPWRTVGVKYTTNEVYFDINEEIDAIIDRNGHVLRCVAHGNVQVNCKLSGMPDLSLLFYNPRVLEDVAFHPCIRYSRWDQSKVLSFVPPDGAFKLMEYRYVRPF